MRLNKFVREVDASHAAGRDAPSQSQATEVAPRGTSKEWNICGVVVHARPEKRQQVAAELGAKPGVEIHHATDDGRFIVTIEDVPEQWAGATLTSFYDVDGVISAALVYHQREIN